MKSTDNSMTIRQTCDLLFAVRQFYSSEISQSVVEYYGDPHIMGSFAMEEMNDDLISKLNDLD